MTKAGPAAPTIHRSSMDEVIEVKRAAYHWAVIEGLPGAEFVARGIDDLSRAVASKEALLVSIGVARLRRIGLQIPEALSSPEDRLYALLAASDPDSAHSRYNALVRRLVSFERSAECAAP